MDIVIMLFIVVIFITYIIIETKKDVELNKSMVSSDNMTHDFIKGLPDPFPKLTMQESYVLNELRHYGEFGISQELINLGKNYKVGNLGTVIFKLKKKGINIKTEITARGSAIYFLNI